MKPDYTSYSIPELQESLTVVDGERFPENKAALERELRSRKNSGEYQRFLEEQQEAEKDKKTDSIHFARKMKKGIGVYLIFGALFFLSQFSFNAAGNVGVVVLATILLVVFLLASLAGGIGLLLNKPWGHFAALIVLGLQVVKIQAGGLVFDFVSPLGIFVYASAETVGFSAELEAGVNVALGSNLPFWFGVNFFVIALIGYLFTAQETNA